MPRLLRALLLLAATLPQLAAAARLEVAIEPIFQGEPLRLDALRYKNAAGETLSVTRLSYLLGGFALERPDGSWLEFPGFHAWLDAAAHRQSFVLEGIPAGRYRALRCHLGPDATADRADVAAIPAGDPLHPATNGLHWGWQQGYIFLAWEGYFRRGAGEMQGYSHHLAGAPHRVGLHLAAPLDLSQDGGLQLNFDLALLGGAPRPLSFAEDGASTHSREGDPVAAALAANLPGAFQVQNTASAAPPPAAPARPPAAPIDLPTAYTPWRFVTSRSFPLPELPRDNPLIAERVTLGEALFSETLLSRDGSLSCASCHRQEAAFTDGLPVSRGVEGRLGERNAMSLHNLAWKRSFFWDGRAPSLREQVLQPIADHREMDQSLEGAVEKLGRNPTYAARFRAAYRSPGISPAKIALALEQYLLTLTSQRSRFDLSLIGKEVLSEEEQRGFELFMTEYDPRTGQRGADCFHCHGGPLFSDQQFHNNGLAGEAPGRAAVTGAAADQGKFATPSLRNVARTAPYMHDGRFASLEEVVQHYSGAMVRRPTLDPNLAKHPSRGLELSAADQAALVAFLKTLSEIPGSP